MSQEKKCYCPCTVSDLCTCQKCIVGFHMPSPIVEEWDKQARNLHEGIVEEKEGWEIEFDKLVYSYEENGWGDGGKIKVVNAEHLGDVSSKLLPDIKSFIRSTLAEQREGVIKKIEKYFEGLIHISLPQKTKESLINIIKNNK